MKLLHIVKEDELRLAVFTEHGVLDVVQAGQAYDMPVAASLKQLILQGEAGLQAVEAIVAKAMHQNSEWFESEAAVVYGPSVNEPEKIICIGLNYVNHAAESKMAVPTEPIVFSKFRNALAAHNEPVALPDVAAKYDYEAELVIIIGKEAYRVSEEDAYSYIFGYTAGNDLSARDLQFKSGQWLIGKTLDRFAPVGPYVVPASAIDPHALTIECRVNGEVRQQANTRDMIFHCDTIVSYLSQYMTLKPGDVIFSGTPDGVILGYPEDEQVWLAPGDEVTVTIEGIGTLWNRLT